MIKLFDGEKNPLTTMGNGAILLYGSDGNERVFLGRREAFNENGTLEIRNKTGKIVARIDADDAGGNLILLTQAGQPMVSVGGVTAPAGNNYSFLTAGTIRTYGFNGKSSMDIGITRGGYGSLQLYDDNYVSYFRLPPEAQKN